ETIEENKYPYKVLLFEDNKTNQFIAQSLLEQVGYTVKIVENGLIGVEEFKLNPDSYDIILMDLHMPVMNGFEASSEILKINSKIPIIAMTADAITGIEEKCRDVGITNFISKPFDPATLAEKVYEFIKNSPNPSTSVQTEKESSSQYESILDEKFGLLNVGGNKAIYESILKIFYDENVDTINALDKHMNENDVQGSIQLVHKIKGSTGAIGAKPLYETAIQFQKALQENDTNAITYQHRTFKKQLSDLLKEIEQKI
ncbi:MAG TPA: response regulator, partial [Erysipelotrichaceae bacterium]|nr:response regulator [Erysipelotrichaceae bacterium]